MSLRPEDVQIYKGALTKYERNLNMLQKIQDLIIDFNLLNDEKDELDTDLIEVKIYTFLKNKEVAQKKLGKSLLAEKKPEPTQGLLKEQEEFFETVRKRRPLRRMGKPLNKEEEEPKERLQGVEEQEEFFKEKARQRERKRTPLRIMGKPLNDYDDYRRKYLQYKLKYFRLKEKNNL